MYNANYLSKRPFLVINTKFLPAARAQTHVAGWAEKSGWNVSEEVAIVDRVTKRHQTYATLILDVLEDKVIKNGFRGSESQDVKAHYLRKFAPQIVEALDIWATSEAQTLASEAYKAELVKMTAITPEEQAVIDEVVAEKTK